MRPANLAKGVCWQRLSTMAEILSELLLLQTFFDIPRKV